MAAPAFPPVPTFVDGFVSSATDMFNLADAILYLKNQEWGAFDGIQTAPQSIPTATDTGINLSNVVLDTAGEWSALTPHAYRPSISLKAWVMGIVCFAADTAGTYRQAKLYKGNTFTSSVYCPGPILAPTDSVMFASTFMVPMAFNGTDEFVMVAGRHNKGSNLDTATSDGASRLIVIPFSK